MKDPKYCPGQQIFTSQIFVLVVVFGLYNGLVVLPVLLSYCGPSYRPDPASADVGPAEQAGDPYRQNIEPASEEGGRSLQEQRHSGSASQIGGITNSNLKLIFYQNRRNLKAPKGSKQKWVSNLT